jgi:hypothetical protein
MGHFALRTSWRWFVLGAAAWAAACGSSEGHHHPGVGDGQAGSNAAGTTTTGGSSGTSGTSGSGGTGTSGSANGGRSGGATAGAAAMSANGGEPEGGNAGHDETAGDSSLGGAGQSNGTGGTHAGKGGTTAVAGEGGEGGVTAETGPITPASKVDLLFVIDNSLSMYPKQSVLAATIPKFVSRLVDPWCTGGGDPPAPATGGVCPAGRQREMAPLRDLHIGIVTTSLGDHGSGDVCSDAQNAQNVQNGMAASDYNDHGRLLPAVRGGLPSWNGTGFLNWDPDGLSTPPGQNDVTNLVTDLHTMIAAVGAHGCGYESTLEAGYRFLVDPEPPLVIGHDTAPAYTTVSTDPSNIDQDVLSERAAFLRPDSAVVIVSLSDENDCSIIDDAGSQGWLVGYKGGVTNLNWHMPRANAACAANPNDTCCRPCGDPQVAGCPDTTTDAACSMGIDLTIQEDSMNLRCFHEVQRFGVDLLYPISRYLNGLTRDSVPKRSGGTAPNPLLAGGRDSRLVLYAPIVGVPWQDIAVDPMDTTNLELMNALELRSSGRWPMLVGDYAHLGAPTDPFMIESIDPRSGNNPVTGDPIVPATSTNPLATINGHEMTPLSARDDLQTACIFQLPDPIVCDGTNADGCDCNDDELSTNMAVCQPPEGGPAATTQYFDHAYPGTRHLELARELGDRSVISSICPRNTTSSSRDDYGYLPAMRAIQTRLTSLVVAP